MEECVPETSVEDKRMHRNTGKGTQYKRGEEWEKGRQVLTFESVWQKTKLCLFFFPLHLGALPTSGVSADWIPAWPSSKCQCSGIAASLPYLTVDIPVVDVGDRLLVIQGRWAFCVFIIEFSGPISTTLPSSLIFVNCLLQDCSWVNFQ